MRKLCALATGALLFGSAAALAAEVAPEDVKIVDGVIEASLTGVPGDPAKGKEAFVGRKLGNCLACHQVTALADDYLFHGETGPSLDGVAGVYSEGELRARVVHPKTINEYTMMPSFYRVSGMNRVGSKFEGKTILTAQQVEDVVAYLLTFKE